MTGSGAPKAQTQDPVAGVLLEKGGYRARLAQGGRDVKAAQALRARCFQTGHVDQDAFDARCLHVLIERQSKESVWGGNLSGGSLPDGTLVGCFRVMLLSGGQELHASYSAQFYDLSPLSSFSERMMELGRFCIDPDLRDPDVLRLAWGAVTTLVDAKEIALLFGCSSFAGTRPARYSDAFALLQRRYLAPPHWRPGPKAPDRQAFADLLQGVGAQKPDLKRAQAQLPPLLRSYLVMGGWVSDHVVIDTALKTCHVFTGLEVAGIPNTRKRLLRGVAEQS